VFFFSRIFEILPTRIKQWHSSPCVADENNRVELERIRSLQLLAREKLLSLDRRHRELNELIDRAKRTPLQPEPEVCFLHLTVDHHRRCLSCCEYGWY
jgi:COMPASS component SPP1